MDGILNKCLLTGDTFVPIVRLRFYDLRYCTNILVNLLKFISQLRWFMCTCV